MDWKPMSKLSSDCARNIGELLLTDGVSIWQETRAETGNLPTHWMRVKDAVPLILKLDGFVEVSEKQMNELLAQWLEAATKPNGKAGYIMHTERNAYVWHPLYNDQSVILAYQPISSKVCYFNATLNDSAQIQYH